MRTVKRWRDARVEDLITHPRAGISPDTIAQLRRDFLGVGEKPKDTRSE